jgi:hypothetical protein
MWTCPQCGEQLEDQFDSCWKCDQRSAEAARPQEGTPPVIDDQLVCSRCGSPKVVPTAGVRDQNGHVSQDWAVFVEDEPEVRLLPKRAYGHLRARVCGECGYTELWTDNSAELYDAYLRSSGESS